MTVRELCELYVEDTDIMEIRKTDDEKTVFTGSFYEAIDCRYCHYLIENFVIQEGMLVINI